MAYRYKTKGTCSRYIDIDMDGTTIKDVKFYGGCDGNLQAVSKLVEGMSYEEAKEKLEGINCNGKGTSCPDQLIKGIEEYLSTQN